jgi:hypothetical protein
MAEALWDMSHGRCNYSEFTAEEFRVLKECGDAEQSVEQGNNEVRILYNSTPLHSSRLCHVPFTMH